MELTVKNPRVGSEWSSKAESKIEAGVLKG
jgi:hypothetical protein